MELNSYQEASLEKFVRWHGMLEEQRAEAEKAEEALRKAGVKFDAVDYPKKAWAEMAGNGDVADSKYVSRAGRGGLPIPHVCFKIPTGGGKTLMAAADLEKLNLRSGLVLWVVPTKKIYEQTELALRKRDSPVRERLERGSGGRVKILKKDDPLRANDVKEYLCVMLLTLASINRNNDKEFLRLNRDSGTYQSFFPDRDDASGNADLLKTCPDLELGEGGTIRNSLANVFRMNRPVVILDEAHKAYGKNSLPRST